MATKLDQWNGFLAIDRLRRRLRVIEPGNGYNMRVHVVNSYIGPDQISETQLPCVCILPKRIEPHETAYGEESFTEDLTMAVDIYGYVRDEHDATAAVHALFIDIMSAIWLDETFADAVTLTDFAGADFDPGIAIAPDIGIVRIELEMSLQAERGAPA